MALLSTEDSNDSQKRMRAVLTIHPTLAYPFFSLMRPLFLRVSPKGGRICEGLLYSLNFYKRTADATSHNLHHLVTTSLVSRLYTYLRICSVRTKLLAFLLLHCHYSNCFLRDRHLFDQIEFRHRFQTQSNTTQR